MKNRLWRHFLAALSLWGCAHHIHGDLEKPFGQALLEAAPSERNFESCLMRASRESEIFRRRFIAQEGPAVIAATLRFQKEATPLVEGRRGIGDFELDAASLFDQIRTGAKLSGDEVFGAFAGKWYGLWTDFEVDHHWGEVVELEGPLRVEIPGSETPVWIRSYQYAWVGDGYGLNLVATSDPASPGRDYILGYVVHVESKDLSRERMRRPHVGVFTGPGQLIWITSGEVFLEASFETPSGDAAYSITGFHYEVSEGAVRHKECFQAVYTRDPDRRPEFFSFSVE